MTKNRDPKLKNIDTQIKNNFRRSRRAKRAGVPDAVLSSGARSAPELRPASGSRGLASDPQEVRKCQPLKKGPRNLRKCLQPLTGCNNFLNQRQGCSSLLLGRSSSRLETSGSETGVSSFTSALSQDLEAAGALADAPVAARVGVHPWR